VQGVDAVLHGEHRARNLGSVELRQDIAEVAAARGPQCQPVFQQQAEGDGRVRERVLAHHPGAVAVLSRLRLEELEPGGEVVEEPPDGDCGAAGTGLPFALDDVLAVEGEDRAQRLVGEPGGELDIRDGGDAGQGLAPEAQRLDDGEVLKRVYLARGVALEGEFDVCEGDSGAVVSDADVLHATASQLDVYLAGAGIDGVLDELLDHGRRALDNFAGGDAGDDAGRQYVQFHGASLHGGV